MRLKKATIEVLSNFNLKYLPSFLTSSFFNFHKNYKCPKCKNPCYLRDEKFTRSDWEKFSYSEWKEMGFPRWDFLHSYK